MCVDYDGTWNFAKSKRVSRAGNLTSWESDNDFVRWKIWLEATKLIGEHEEKDMQVTMAQNV